MYELPLYSQIRLGLLETVSIKDLSMVKRYINYLTSTGLISYNEETLRLINEDVIL